ncbi:cbb3-type cytochrome c oxidase subunit I [Streptomyces sp. NPDC005898]|uniref:cbb3-type cytochrome c oxidase subunit I n=1 Tax=Streptomyces sp. NPDC005898 TaxID=3157082 RepID=UPI0034073FB8
MATGAGITARNCGSGTRSSRHPPRPQQLPHATGRRRLRLTAYTPLSGGERTPYIGGDLWIMGLALAGFGTILGAVDFITTIICMRAPGMTMFRMPIFTWNVLLTSVLVPLAFPVLAAALLVLEADRRFDALVSTRRTTGPFSGGTCSGSSGTPRPRKPIFGYMGLVGATIAITGLSVTVWAHHMFATGAALLPFFAFMTYLIAVPTGVKFFPVLPRRRHHPGHARQA